MRARIRQEIAGIEPADAKEARARREALRWVDSGAELCRIEKPATPPRHLVSYFAVIDGDYLLLVEHINAGLWLPSGGHVEPGEHPRDTVRRESLEELGLAARFLREEPCFLTVTETVGSTAGHTDVSLWYLLSGSRHEAMDFDHAEFHGVRWFHLTEIPFRHADPELSRFVSKMTGMRGGET